MAQKIYSLLPGIPLFKCLNGHGHARKRPQTFRGNLNRQRERGIGRQMSQRTVAMCPSDVRQFK